MEGVENGKSSRIHMDSNMLWNGMESGSPLQGSKDSEGFIEENVEVSFIVYNRVSNIANHQGWGPEGKTQCRCITPYFEISFSRKPFLSLKKAYPFKFLHLVHKPKEV